MCVCLSFCVSVCLSVCGSAAVQMDEWVLMKFEDFLVNLNQYALILQMGENSLPSFNFSLAKSICNVIQGVPHSIIKKQFTGVKIHQHTECIILCHEFLIIILQKNIFFLLY